MKNRTLLVPALMLCCAATLSGCGRNEGAKTFEFLKAEQAILKNTQQELKQLPIPQAPAPPDHSEAENAKRALKAKEAYESAVIEYCQHAESLLNNAQTEISRLDSSGVGEDAVTLTKSCERLLGDRSQGFVEIKALTNLDLAGLLEKKQHDLMTLFMMGEAAYGLFTEDPKPVLDALKHAADEASEEVRQQNEVRSHFVRLEETVVALEHDRVEMVTERSELVTSYRAKYPEYQWDSFLPPPDESKH